MIRFAENLNKMIVAGLGGALEAPRTEVAVGHRIIYTEASGDVVNFETNVIAPVKNLRVTMEPIQDLHGYDSPWPAGGGINKFSGQWPPDVTGTYAGWNTGATTICTLKLFDKGNGADISGVYFGVGVNGATTPVLWAIQNGSIAQNPIQTGANFSTTLHPYVTMYPNTEETLTKVLNRFDVMATLDGVDYHVFSPYSNICPITGRDSVTVWRGAVYDPSADPALTIALGQTVYGGTLDVTKGRLLIEWENIASYNGETLPGEWISDRDVYAPGTTPTIGAQVCYKLAEPLTIQLTPAQLNTLDGQNNVWSNAGNISLEYPYYEETEGY